MPNVQFGLDDSDIYSLTVEQRTATELWMMFSTSAAPPNQYLNLKTPRNRSFYGFCQLMFGAAVVETIQLEFINQIIYYSYQSTPEILDAIACAVKAIANPPEITVTPLRRPLTAVRFRLVPGCFGNLQVNWLPFTSDCGNTIVDPPNEQGEPPSRSNDRQDPALQPPASREDPYDPTPNDDGLPIEELPDELPPTGTWYFVVTFGAPSGETQTFSAPGRSTDKVVLVSLPVRTDEAECFQGRVGLSINGAVAAETQNCVSPIASLTGPFYTGGNPPG